MKNKGVWTGEAVLLSGSQHRLRSSVSTCVTVSSLPFSSAPYAVAVKVYSCTTRHDTLSLPVVLRQQQLLAAAAPVYTYALLRPRSLRIYVKYKYLFTTSTFDVI